MAAARSGARHWIAAGALFLSAVLANARSAAVAGTSFDVGDGAIVQVVSSTASVTVRTWNRNTVQIDSSDDGAFALSRRSVAPPAVLYIRPVSVEEQRYPDGPIVTTLLPEDFPVPKVSAGKHDAIHIKEIVRPPDASRAAGARAAVTVTIPETTGMLSIRTNSADVTVDDYRGTIAAVDTRGSITFHNVGGDAFVQPLYGHFYAVGSLFDRLRIRSASADEVFDGCRVRQIEATTLTGSIVFDNGVFDTGLANFESDRGSIAIGVSGGAQVGARADEGNVFSALPITPAPAAPMIVQPDRDRLRIAGDGGPLVNVMSAHGNVLLYDGSLAERRPATLGAAWRPLFALFMAGRRSAERAQAMANRHRLPTPHAASSQ